MKKIEITESNKYLLSALADCPIGTEIIFNDGVIEVDYVWTPKKGDEVFYLDSDMDAVSSYIIFENNFKGNVFDFRTKELAEAALEVLKNLKHY